jgi:hypothetical protein
MIVVGTAPFTDDMLLRFVVTGAAPAGRLFSRRRMRRLGRVDARQRQRGTT